MSDIKQNTSTGTIQIENNDLVLITGIEAIGQDITRSIRTIKREWFLDQSLGVDYFNEIFIKGQSLRVIETRFKQAILDVPGVLSLKGFRLEKDSENRTLSLTIDSVVTADGSFPYADAVGV